MQEENKKWEETRAEFLKHDSKSEILHADCGQMTFNLRVESFVCFNPAQVGQT